MSFGTTESIVRYDGNDVQTTFEIPFDYLNRDYIRAELYDARDPENIITTPLVVNVDFRFLDDDTVETIELDTSGPEVVIVPKPVETGVVIHVYRSTPDNHLINYNTYHFPASVVDLDFDQVYQVLQELRREVDRAIKLAYDNSNSITGEDLQNAIDLLAQIEALVESGALGLPTGGKAGDFLQRTDSIVAGEGAEWVNGSYTGYSMHLQKFVSATSLDEAIRILFDFQYTPPTIALATSPSTGVREFGVIIPSVTMNANAVKTAEPLERIEFYVNAALVSTDSSVNPEGGSSSYTDSNPFSETRSFRARVYDVTGGNAWSNTVSYSFVYPYYFGVGAQGLTGAQIGALTKDVRANTNNLVKDYTITVAEDVFYLAHPIAYQEYTLIKDANGFDVTDSWTIRTVLITGLDGTTQSYKVYEFKLKQAVGTAQFTFSR